MAKKQKTKVEIDTTSHTVEQPVVETPVVEVTKPKENIWEIKDRSYILKGGLTPLSHKIPSRNIAYFDEDLGYERELKYTVNQKTPFVEDFKGEARIAHITFRNGSIRVPKNKQTLQKLLSLYHPLRDVLYEEVKPAQAAADHLDMLELEMKAMNAAFGLDIDTMEAILRVEIGSRVSKMSSKEIKRDLLIFAKGNPGLFLELLNDGNVQLRNIGIRATESGIIRLSQDNRTFLWGSNNRKLMTIPFDEHPYSALAAWFKTDEGMEVLSTIEKKLK